MFFFAIIITVLSNLYQMQNLKNALKMKIYPPHYHRMHSAWTSGKNVPHSLFLNLGAMILRYWRIAKNHATPVKTKQQPTLNQHNATPSLARGVGKIHHVFFHSHLKKKPTMNVQRRVIRSIGALQQHLFHGMILDIAMNIVQQSWKSWVCGSSNNCLWKKAI